MHRLLDEARFRVLMSNNGGELALGGEGSGKSRLFLGSDNGAKATSVLLLASGALRRVDPWVNLCDLSILLPRWSAPVVVALAPAYLMMTQWRKSDTQIRNANCIVQARRFCFTFLGGAPILLQGHESMDHSTDIKSSRIEAKLAVEYYLLLLFLCMLWGLGIVIHLLNRRVFPKWLDDGGITTRSGRRHRWDDLVHVERQRLLVGAGGPRLTGNLTLKFKTGTVRIGSFGYSNLGQILSFVSAKLGLATSTG